VKNKLILVSGYCAAGKSAFSRELAARLSLPCFNKDTIKEVIGDGFGAENTDVHRKNSAVTFALMLHIAERFLQAGKVCVLESNFRLSESEKINALLAKYGCDCLTFLFTGDLDVLYKRYAEREKTERHWVHLTVGEDRDFFVKGHLEGGFDKVKLGRTVCVDATDFAKVDYKELFSVAERFLSV